MTADGIMYGTTTTDIEYLAQLQIRDRTAAAARRRRRLRLRHAVTHRRTHTANR